MTYQLYQFQGTLWADRYKGVLIHLDAKRRIYASLDAFFASLDAFLRPYWTFLGRINDIEMSWCLIGRIWVIDWTHLKRPDDWLNAIEVSLSVQKSQGDWLDAFSAP